MSELRGIIAPFTTPFTESGYIDLDLVPAQVDWLISNGVHGLAAGGSTGEGHALSREEYRTLMETTTNAVAGRVPLVAGIIANSTAEVEARGDLVKDLGVAALQVTPTSYLFRPDDDAMVQHFSDIHAACGAPILIYNVVPWCYLSPDLLLRIMDEVPGVLGVKQSAGDMKLFADLIRSAKPEYLIFSAVDALLFSSYQLGAPGSIAAILTAAPGPSVKLWDAVAAGDLETARHLHEFPPIGLAAPFPRRVRSRSYDHCAPRCQAYFCECGTGKSPVLWIVDFCRNSHPQKKDFLWIPNLPYSTWIVEFPIHKIGRCGDQNKRNLIFGADCRGCVRRSPPADTAPRSLVCETQRKRGREEGEAAFFLCGGRTNEE